MKVDRLRRVHRDDGSRFEAVERPPIHNQHACRADPHREPRCERPPTAAEDRLLPSAFEHRKLGGKPKLRDAGDDGVAKSLEEVHPPERRNSLGRDALQLLEQVKSQHAVRDGALRTVRGQDHLIVFLRRLGVPTGSQQHEVPARVLTQAADSGSNVPRTGGRLRERRMAPRERVPRRRLERWHGDESLPRRPVGVARNSAGVTGIGDHGDLGPLALQRTQQIVDTANRGSGWRAHPPSGRRPPARARSNARPRPDRSA